MQQFPHEVESGNRIAELLPEAGDQQVADRMTTQGAVTTEP
jgi:hypothetical protein